MQRAKYGSFIAAAVIYAAFAVYLYQPYFKNFDKLQWLVVVNVSLAALGCFVLSRRWVAGFAGSFFAGAIYGFGPFTLGLVSYHPSVGLLAASIPWLFCPAAFGPKGEWRWVSVSLSVLPFLAILLFFQMTAAHRLFPIPIRVKLQVADLAGLLAPLAMIERSLILIGFYQVPIASLIMGFSMLLAARRFSIIIIFCLGTILAFCNAFFNISPIIWLTLPVLCCSVLIGVGMQGMVSAGSADRKWLLTLAIIMGILAVVTLLVATKYIQLFAGVGKPAAKILTRTAIMYLLGAIATAIIFFMARAKLRIHWLRWLVLSSAMAVDIFLGAGFIADTVL